MTKNIWCSAKIRLLIVFLCGLIISLGLGFVNPHLIHWGNVAIAQTSHQGDSLYKNGNFSEAIKLWQEDLKYYQSINDLNNSARILENLARVHQKIGDMSQIIKYWQEAIATYQQLNNSQQEGRMLIEMAQVYTMIGQPQRAIDILCNPPQSDDKNNQENKKFDEHNCHQESALKKVQTDEKLKVAALGSLGESYRLIGEYQTATDILTQSLNNVEKIKNINYKYALLNSRGNTYLSQANYDQRRAKAAANLTVPNENTIAKLEASFKDNYLLALNDFQTAIKIANQQKNYLDEVQTLLNLIPLYYRLEVHKNIIENSPIKPSYTAKDALKKAENIFNILPDNHDKIYLGIKLSDLLQPVASIDEIERIFDPQRCIDTQFYPQAENLLNKSKELAEKINDNRAASFAWGKMGHIYECKKDYTQALKYTQKARLLAQQKLQSQDSLYLWDWQAARIYIELKQEDQAEIAYEEAINTLEQIRTEILTNNREIQFDFRDNIKPLYQDFIALKLEQSEKIKRNFNKENQDKNNATKNSLQDNLKAAMNSLDSLKLAELQDYFGNKCKLITFSQEKIEQLVNKNTVVFSSIVLPERTAIIATLPDGQKDITFINLDEDSLRKKIDTFRQQLERFRDPLFSKDLAQELYKDIIKPFEKFLHKDDTLVFIQDDVLRSIPMAALHDGENFLIENYNIANTPSLTVTIPTEKTSQTKKALILGLSEESKIDNKPQEQLESVQEEVKEIKNIFPDNDEFLNQAFDFNKDKDNNKLKTLIKNINYSVIHIATHGQFSTVREDSFLVTGAIKDKDGNNETLKMSDLEQIIREKTNPQLIEILTLSACQTAVGDDRATLGLAGVGLQAGVRSALASLWSVNDEATKILVTEFYNNWHKHKMSKAKALRMAQIRVLNYKDEDNDFTHPAYWSPFIMIGNWL